MKGSRQEVGGRECQDVLCLVPCLWPQRKERREEVRREEGKGKKLENQGGSGYERLAGF